MLCFRGRGTFYFCFWEKGSWREGGMFDRVLGNEGKGGDHAVFFCITKPWSSSREARKAYTNNSAHSGTKDSRPP